MQIDVEYLKNNILKEQNMDWWESVLTDAVKRNSPDEGGVGLVAFIVEAINKMRREHTRFWRFFK